MSNAEAIGLTHLDHLLELSSGRPDVLLGLIDGPVDTRHEGLTGCAIRGLGDAHPPACRLHGSLACVHGTLVAGILSANRGSGAPGLAPDCTLLVRPVFPESQDTEQITTAEPAGLARALVETIDAGPNVVNMSLAVRSGSIRAGGELQCALDYAMSKRIPIVAAAGNDASVGTSVITQHPWVLPVIACDQGGRPLSSSSLGGSIAKRGLMAPGAGIRSLASSGKCQVFEGTSAAAAFVTGAIALLLSLFPGTSWAKLRVALVASNGGRRLTIVPPLLDARAAYRALARTY